MAASAVKRSENHCLEIVINKDYWSGEDTLRDVERIAGRCITQFAVGESDYVLYFRFATLNAAKRVAGELFAAFPYVKIHKIKEQIYMSILEPDGLGGVRDSDESLTPVIKR